LIGGNNSWVMMDLPDSRHLLVPLPLAELLFVTLGPLSDVLAEEDHRWAPLVKMVLRAYRTGRDDMIEATYGKQVVRDIDLCTYLVSEQLAVWVAELGDEATDFDKWAEELGSYGDETGNEHGQ
jgi:hypothetical protein